VEVYVMVKLFFRRGSLLGRRLDLAAPRDLIKRLMGIAMVAAVGIALANSSSAQEFRAA